MDVARSLLILVCAAGCYAPTPAENRPCSESGECPDGQLCQPSTQRCVKMLATDGPADAPPDSPTDARLLVDAPPDAALTEFTDSFERADSDALGNGWIEKAPETFSIADTKVIRIETGSDYRDNLVYRPASEDVRDVEMAIEVQFSTLPPNYPQVFVRGVSASMGATDSYTGYLLYVAGETVANEMILGRQIGSVFVETLAGFTLSESFVVGPRYRLTLRATGASSVMLEARVERLTSSGAVLIGQVATSDTAQNRITTAGTVGFSGDDAASYSYDNFRRTPL